MQRSLVAACAFALVLTLGVRADEAKDKEKKVGPKEIFQELVKKFSETKDKGEQKKLFTTYGQKLVDYARQNSKDDSAIDALMLVMRIPVPEGKGSPKEQAVDILAREYAKSKKIAPIVGRLGEDEASTRLLTAVMKENPDKKVQGAACFQLVSGKESALGLASQLKTDKEGREEFDKENGKGSAEKLVAAIATTKKDLASLVETLRKEYKDSAKGVFVGEKMPELTSENLKGDKVRLSGLEGKVVVLDIWATWCGPCKAMIPHERELVKKLEGKPFALVSVSFDDEKKTLTEFLEKTPMPWTHWFNGRTGMLGKELDVRFFPTVFVLDAKGVVRFKNVRGKAMDAAVESLLAETKGEKKAKPE